MDHHGHFTRIAGDECRQLVRARAVGRVAWAGADGVQVLPVSYTVTGDRIAFRTSPESVLGALVEPTDVVFEVDDVEEDTATGWSVVVRGRASGRLDEVPEGIELPRPWSPGENRLTIVLEPTSYTGRAVSADTPGGS